MKKKCVGYIRVSSISSAEDGSSLKSQREHIEQRAKAEGWNLIKIYEDAGISGKDIEGRPAFKEMLADAAKGEFEIFLFAKLDRIARSLRDMLNVFHDLKEERGIDLVCTDDPVINSTGPFGEALIQIVGVFAELERKMIAIRTGEGKMKQWRAGKAVMGSVPYGMRRKLGGEGEKKYAAGVIEKDPEKSKIYLRAVSLYLDARKSLYDIALLFNEEHIAKPYERGSQGWSAATLSNILRNPAYMGKKILNQIDRKKEKPKKINKANPPKHRSDVEMQARPKKGQGDWIERAYPKLIEPERWQQLQARLKKNRRKSKHNYKEAGQHFLCDGFAFCACGARMKPRPRIAKDGSMRFSYLCRHQAESTKMRKLSGHKKCNLKSVDADAADAQAFEQVVRVMVNPFEYAQSYFRDVPLESLVAAIAALKEEKGKIEKQLDAGFDYMRKHADSKNIGKYEEAQARDEIKLEKIKKQLEAKEREYETIAHKKESLQKFGKAVEDIGWKNQGEFAAFLRALPFNEKRRILEAMISPEKESLRPGGNRVEFAYATPKDYLDDAALNEMSFAESVEQKKSMALIVEAHFDIDIDKIHAIIESLPRGELIKDRKSVV